MEVSEQCLLLGERTNVYITPTPNKYVITYVARMPNLKTPVTGLKNTATIQMYQFKRVHSMPAQKPSRRRAHAYFHSNPPEQHGTVCSMRWSCEMLVTN
jgi:hypothetical protein